VKWVFEKKDEKQRVILGLKGNALFLSLTDFVINCGLFLTNVFWSLFILNLGASIYELGLFVLITGLLPVFFISPIGYLGDKIGSKKLMVGGAFAAALGTFLNAFAVNWWTLIPGTLLSSILQIVRPLWQTLVAEDINPLKRGKSYATVFTIAFLLPNAFMPIFSGIFLDYLGLELGMRYMLGISSLLSFLVAFLRLRFLKEKTPIKPGFKISFKNIKTTIAEMFSPLSQIKMLKVMLLGSSASAFAFGMLSRFESVFAVEIIGLTKTEWGLIIAGLSILRILTRIPLGGITDRWGRRRCILIHFCFQPIFIFLFAFTQNFLSVFLVMAGRVIVFNLGAAAWQAMLVDITPINLRRLTYGTMGTFEMTSRSISPVFGSFFWESFSPASIFYLTALVRVFAAIVLFKFLKEPKVGG
jgi:MFS family permease